MKKKLTLEQQISHFKRMTKANPYGGVIVEQEGLPEEPPVPADDEALPPAGGGEELPADDLPVDDGMGEELPADDLPMDDAVPEMDETEELDITDLVNLTKSIKNDLDDQRNQQQPQEDVMGQIMGRLDALNGFGEKIDGVMSKIDALEYKVEKMKEPTPEERLEMRSLDSFPFKSNPVDFFRDKKIEMERSGKNNYILTKNDVENYSPSQVVKSFNPDNETY